MGRKLDAILGRNFRSSKFKALANLAISRLAVFKNQRQVRCNQARSDVVQLLEQGHHESALLRVEYVIKEQKMLDVYVMMEGYLNLLVERIHLIEQERVCPDELQEAISSLLFASSRCGDFPELQEIRAVLTTRYGREFTARSIELRNNCGVNPKMIQKLSTRQTDLENRTEVLKEIASEHGLVRQLEEGNLSGFKDKKEESKKQNQPEPEMATTSGSSEPNEKLKISLEQMQKDGLSDSMKARKKYKDVADAAQAAFESANYAAEAARAALELSRSDPHDPDNHDRPDSLGKKASDRDEPMNPQPKLKNQEILKGKSVVEHKRSPSTSSSDSAEATLKETTMSMDTEDPAKLLEKDVVFDYSDNESHDSGSSIKAEDKFGEHIPSVLQSGRNVDSRKGYAAEVSGIRSPHRLNLEKGPISLRTRRVRGF